MDRLHGDTHPRFERADLHVRLVHEEGLDPRYVEYPMWFESLDPLPDGRESSPLLTEWLQRTGQTDQVVVSSMAPWVYVRTGMHAVLPPLERRLDVVGPLLDTVPATYVIVDTCGLSFTRKYTLPFVSAARDQWRLSYTAPQGGLEIYERRPPVPGVALAATRRRGLN